MTSVFRCCVPQPGTFSYLCLLMFLHRNAVRKFTGLKYLLFWSIPLLFACSTPEKPDPRLLGTWELPVIDGETREVIDQMKMTFRADGVLIYETSTDGQEKEKYHVSNGELYTTRKDSGEEKGKFEFQDDHTLVLHFDGTTQVLKKLK